MRPRKPRSTREHGFGIRHHSRAHHIQWLQITILSSFAKAAGAPSSRLRFWHNDSSTLVPLHANSWATYVRNEAMAAIPAVWPAVVMCLVVQKEIAKISAVLRSCRSVPSLPSGCKNCGGSRLQLLKDVDIAEELDERDLLPGDFLVQVFRIKRPDQTRVTTFSSKAGNNSSRNLMKAGSNGSPCFQSPCCSIIKRRHSKKLPNDCTSHCQ